MSSPALTWVGVVEEILDGFRVERSVVADWLALPGTGHNPRLDLFYSELDIAFMVPNSLGPPGWVAPAQRRSPPPPGGRAETRLLVLDGKVGAHSPVWGEIDRALSFASRRVAQQPMAGDVKLHLLPRIADARDRARKLQAALSAMHVQVDSVPQQGRQTLAVGQGRTAENGWSVVRARLASVSSLYSPVLSILKRIALLLLVLLAVNAASYLVANFLDLRGPMAYNYVPDTKVAFSEVIESYPDYLRNVLRGDFGMMRQDQLRGMLFSQQHIPILGLVLQRLPRSLVLLGIAMLIAIVVGIAAGFLSVNYKTYRTNPLALILSLAGFSMPGFYLAILILYLMIWAAMEHGRGMFFLPTTGFGLDEHLVLPALALAARPTAEIARLTAELLGEELPKDYIRVARAKGLPERWVITHHAFRNVVSAVINAMSNSWSYVIGSLVIIERVFAWGGVGEALLDSVTFSQFGGSSFNPALVATLATALTLLFVVADLITSSIAQVADPRLQKANGGAA